MRVFRKRGHWWIDFREPDGRRRRKSIGKSEREAEAALERVRLSIIAGTYYDDHCHVQAAKSADLTLEQLWKEFEAGRTGVSPSTSQDERIRAEKVILPFFGKTTSCQGYGVRPHEKRGGSRGPH